MEAAVATKFVKWEVPTLESLHEYKVYRLRMKVNNGEVLNREEKNWITEKVNVNTYFKSAIPLQGWRFDFSYILRTLLVSQYGQQREYKAMDKTALRKILYGRTDRIVELDKLTQNDSSNEHKTDSAIHWTCSIRISVALFPLDSQYPLVHHQRNSLWSIPNGYQCNGIHHIPHCHFRLSPMATDTLN